MKKIVLLLLLPLMAILFPSCTNLESEMYNTINPGIFPQNQNDADALVIAAAYAALGGDPWGGMVRSNYTGVQTVGELLTDIGDIEWAGLGLPDLQNVNLTVNSSLVTGIYTYQREISRMTLTLERIAGVDMPQSVKERLNAELHCGKGWVGFLLYDWYGPVQIAPLEVLQDPLNEEVLPRLSKEEMVSFIETELKEAIKGLPANYVKGDANYGRYTRGLAYTVLMKLYMHEGDWAKAEECGRELMKPEYGYALAPEYEDVFTFENEKNAEIIWAVQSSQSRAMSQWPAHTLPSMYPTENPKITKWSGFRVPWAFYHTFDPADKRLKVLVGEFEGTDGVLYNEENPGIILDKGAIPVKYGEDPTSTGAGSQVDWIIYRYADVLTALSEVIVRRGNAVTQEAIDLLNTVRIRAGITPYTMADFSGVDDFLDKVLLNRGQELWWEGQRRPDLIRHGKFVEFARKYKGSTTAQDFMMLMPIPQGVINEGKGIVIQNPGY
jgi:hypothetical protein